MSAKYNLPELCLQEGWEVYPDENRVVVGGAREFPIAHPFQIYLKIYRDSTIPEEKLYAFQRAHDILWPDMVLTNNDWQRRIFEAHCYGWNHVVLAAGGGAGKSIGAAKVSILFYASRPKKNAVIIASTTLDSLENRIWGYVAKLVTQAALPIPIQFIKGKPPKIIYPGQLDKIHGMFATAIREGDEDRTLGTLIGRHPDYGLMVILDEATNISPNMVSSLPNLEQGVEFFQLWAIGNPASKNDLHGALATPKRGWESIDPERDIQWDTNHRNGTCLYFPPETSPAILETDPIKKAALSKFLITKEKLAEKIETYGKESDAYYRFVRGFWRSMKAHEVIVTHEFLMESRVNRQAEWSGVYPIQMIAGLDPAVSSGQKGCVLRLAVMGQESSGKIVLDYRREELLFYIDVSAKQMESAEAQICERILEVMMRFKVPLYLLALDASGLGRALGELLKLKANSLHDPLKIVSIRPNLLGKGPGGRSKGSSDPNLMTMTPTEMWITMRQYIQSGQVMGLDDKTIHQLCNRRMEEKAPGKNILEDKSKYMARMAASSPANAHSPNEADGAILTLHAAIMRAGLSLGLRRPMGAEVGERWHDKYLAFQRERSQQQAQEALGRRRVSAASFTHSVEDIVWKAN